MAPRFGLEVSPALVSFAEMLMLPFAAMQSVIEEELCSNSALERVDAGECPICRGEWRTRCPVCSVPASGSSSGADAPRRRAGRSAAAEPDTDALLRAVRMETRPPTRRSPSTSSTASTSTGCWTARAPTSPPSSASRRRPSRRCWTSSAGSGRPASAPPASPSACCCSWTPRPRRGAAALARAVITDHLPALAQGPLHLHRGRARSRPRRDQAGPRAHPAPAAAVSGVRRQRAPGRGYVVPDVVVREHDEIPGEFIVDLVEPALTRLGVRATRRGAVPGRRAGARCPRARSFLAQLQTAGRPCGGSPSARSSGSRSSWSAGRRRCKPLTRAEVAAELDLHESTVSRAVADKYALLPDRTIVPLSRFFGASGGRRRRTAKLLESADGPCLRPAPRRPAVRGRLPDRPPHRRQAPGAPRIHRGPAALTSPTAPWLARFLQ